MVVFERTIMQKISYAACFGGGGGGGRIGTEKVFKNFKTYRGTDKHCMTYTLREGNTVYKQKNIIGKSNK